MTNLMCQRGPLRAALVAVMPHAGKASEDTPDFGRVRFMPTGDALLVWATDGITSAVARVPVEDHLDDELDEWDMATAEVKAVQAVLRRPTNPDEQSVWDNAECNIVLTDSRVRFIEHGDLFGGRDVTVKRLQTRDSYPDIPRHLTDTITGALADTPQGGVRGDLLARFVASSKAYEGSILLRFTQDPAAVLVSIGGMFVGEMPTRVGWTSEEAARIYEQGWVLDLEPLRRPVRVKVTDAMLEDLGEQAGRLLAEVGTGGVTLSVVTQGGDQ